MSTIKPTPMDRLITRAQLHGRAEVENSSHWQTLFKAQRLGLLDECGFITEAGRNYKPKQPVSP